MSKVGLLIHTFDNTEDPKSKPWLPCPADQWCAKFGDRMSASIINPKLTKLFSGGNAGIIFSPSEAEIFCSYFADGRPWRGPAQPA